MLASRLMAREMSGPSTQDICMASLEEKFKDLLNFVHLMVKRDVDNEKRTEDINKDASEENPREHSHTNSGPLPVQPLKPEERDSQLDSKLEGLEEKIRLMQGLNSFGNTDFSRMSWFPNMSLPHKFKALEFEKYNGRGNPMIHLQMSYRKMA